MRLSPREEDDPPLFRSQLLLLLPRFSPEVTDASAGRTGPATPRVDRRCLCDSSVSSSLSLSSWSLLPSSSSSLSSSSSSVVVVEIFLRDSDGRPRTWRWRVCGGPGLGAAGTAARGTPAGFVASTPACANFRATMADRCCCAARCCATSLAVGDIAAVGLLVAAGPVTVATCLVCFCFDLRNWRCIARALDQWWSPTHAFIRGGITSARFWNSASPDFFRLSHSFRTCLA
mmetsp:Transcript_55247/g.165550  ORF Transcript_55247/g.165550 Transcript_55247/m.165550 type:complete len:231 (+) Transcript_55247:1360-2052(+)